MEDIEKWKNKLLYLPGINAQLKMAPEKRKAELLFSDNEILKKQSAVLVIIYKVEGEYQLLLTQRAEFLRNHRGQISFPGGKYEKTDIDLKHTALREANEEIGLETDKLIILGWLTPLFIPVSKFNINPLVVFLQEKPKMIKNDNEVAEIIEIPLKDFLKKENIKTKNFETENKKTKILAPYYHVSDVEIWGATAMIISELIECLFSKTEKNQTFNI